MMHSSLEANLIVCLEMLREAASPYVPSSGRDIEWLARRDRVVRNADGALAAHVSEEQSNG